ncbi:MAG: alpha/beta fold hydrolase [Candidatus Binataceae bacterium]
MANDKTTTNGLPPLIPRELLLGNPERALPTISPDAKSLAYVAPDPRGVLQVWVQTIGKDDAKIVTADRKRGITLYGWAWNSNTILYGQDSDGDENFHVFAVDLESLNVRDLTPWQGVRAEAIASNPSFPTKILVPLNIRNRALMDVYRIDIRTGATELDTENPGDVGGWLADDDFVIRLAFVTKPDGGSEIRIRDDTNAPWRMIVTTAPDDAVIPLGFSKDGKSLHLRTSIGSDKTRVVSRAIASGREIGIAGSDVVDAGEVMIHPTRRVIEAVAFAPDRHRWTVIDPAVKSDFEALDKVADGDFSVVSRDFADRVWLVAFSSDHSPTLYYTWDRATRAATFLFGTQPKLAGAALAPMKHVTYRARDGMEIHAYLTLPPGLAPKNLPMVLFVHGGPWARDEWGFSPIAQFYANRGYAVLQPNYRGSTGYGKQYLHAGDLKWGLAMQDDLTDAVEWAVREGIAHPRRIAISGGSYGGYASLAGATFTPEAYCCAIDMVGPSNLFSLIRSFPPYWGPSLGIYRARCGDPDNPADKELLTAASPLFSAHQIRIPMLIGQGANDPRVKQQESEQIVEAIAKNRGRATYVLYSDEGHGFARPDNRLDWYAREEKFLADNLGGRFEPASGERREGSTAVVREIGG